MYDIEKLACNLRKYRKLRGLTQTQLANLVFVSPQNVSKWELGTTYPDINNLCKLAKVLKVSTDSLLAEDAAKDTPGILLAVDGGGTKTEFLLFTQQGEILDRLLLSGTNPNSCGFSKSQAVLKTGVDHMLSLGFPIKGILCGIAGCINETNRKSLLSFLTERYPHIQARVTSDIYNVIYSVEHAENCIAAICGTGSVVYARTSEGLKQLGGWGYLFDNSGSGYDLGRDAICAALADQDGIGPHTLLTELVDAKIGGRATKSMNTLYGAGKDYIASFASLIFKAEEMGDPIAAQILKKNADRLSFLINSAAKLYNSGPAVLLSGGIVVKQPAFRSALFEGLMPHLKPIICDTPQILGAAANCCQSFAELSCSFRKTLENNYVKFIKEENKETKPC